MFNQLTETFDGLNPLKSIFPSKAPNFSGYSVLFFHCLSGSSQENVPKYKQLSKLGIRCESKASKAAFYDA